jgi:hypothetical protein
MSGTPGMFPSPRSGTAGSSPNAPADLRHQGHFLPRGLVRPVLPPMDRPFSSITSPLIASSRAPLWRPSVRRSSGAPTLRGRSTLGRPKMATADPWRYGMLVAHRLYHPCRRGSESTPLSGAAYVSRAEKSRLVPGGRSPESRLRRSDLSPDV